MGIVREVTIGDCRLIQGDCLEVMPLLDPTDAVVTDPPYGMEFQSGHRLEKHRPIDGDCSADLLQFACGIKARHSAYVWMRWDNLQTVLKPKSLITWVKNNWSMGDLGHEHARQTEVAAFYPGPDHFFPNGRPQDVVRAARSDNAFHPTQKPVGLMEAVVRWTSGIVLDPFMGSGTTLVACAKLGRKGIGIELDPDYFDIAVERVRKAYEQPDMFVPAPSKPVESQDDMFSEAAQ